MFLTRVPADALQTFKQIHETFIRVLSIHQTFIETIHRRKKEKRGQQGNDKFIPEAGVSAPSGSNDEKYLFQKLENIDDLNGRLDKAGLTPLPLWVAGSNAIVWCDS